MKIRNQIQITPNVRMYQNGHPTNWFLEISGQTTELENIGDAAEKLISASISDATIVDSAIELKNLIEAMRSLILNWYQIHVG